MQKLETERKKNKAGASIPSKQSRSTTISTASLVNDPSSETSQEVLTFAKAPNPPLLYQEQQTTEGMTWYEGIEEDAGNKCFAAMKEAGATIESNCTPVTDTGLCETEMSGSAAASKGQPHLTHDISPHHESKEGGVVSDTVSSAAGMELEDESKVLDEVSTRNDHPASHDLVDEDSHDQALSSGETTTMESSALKDYDDHVQVEFSTSASNAKESRSSEPVLGNNLSTFSIKAERHASMAIHGPDGAGMQEKALVEDVVLSQKVSEYATIKEGELQGSSSSGGQQKSFVPWLQFDAVHISSCTTQLLQSHYRSMTQFKIRGQGGFALSSFLLEPHRIVHEQRTALVLYNIETAMLEVIIWGF
jgi:hypothetical protein